MRRLAIPLILIIAAAYVYYQVFGSFSPVNKLNTNPTPGRLSQFMAPSETAVCQALDSANGAFVPLKADFEAAASSEETNPIRKEQRLAAARSSIDQLYARRNRAVLDALGWNNPVATRWLVRITDISTAEKDFGQGAAQFATLKGAIPCGTPTTFTSTEMPVASNIGASLTQLNVGDFVLADGNFVSHDTANNPPEVAVEWAGPLYGPFGGLWSDAIEAPSFTININRIGPLPPPTDQR